MKLAEGKSELTFDESKLTIGEGNRLPTEAKLSLVESKLLFHNVIRQFDGGRMVWEARAGVVDVSDIFGTTCFEMPS